MKIWFDDVRPPPDDSWAWCRTNAEARVLMIPDSKMKKNVVEISLDHDLGFHDVELPDDPDELAEVLILRGSSEETGEQLVRWMIENDLVPPKITIHSWNPDGARRMAQLLNAAGHDVFVEPFKA